MKKVWYRVAKIRSHSGTSTRDDLELRRRSRLLSENPASRDRTRNLVRWQVRLGDLSGAEKLANKWLKKDRMDAGVLVELAGIAALRGDPDRSAEFLASAVDADPRSVGAHNRMVKLYRAAGNTDLMCAHALTRALVSPASWKHQVKAIRCGAGSERHLKRLKERGRKRAEKALSKPEKERSVRGRMKVTASWSADQDLDIVVVTPRGRVITWQGGARRTRSRDVTSRRTETLAISMEERGRYRVLMVPRGVGKGRSISGSVRIRAYGKSRTMDFAVSGRAARVADVIIKSKFRYERVSGGRVPVPGTVGPQPSRSRLSNADVLRSINRVRSAVSRCPRKAGASRVVRVRVVVRGNTGRPSSVRVSGSLSGTTTGRCVARAVRRARFPTFRNSSQTFTYPFMLR